MWWYLDVTSDDGRYGLVLIAFVGSVFSPFYARARIKARRGGPTPPAEGFPAINVALYGPGGAGGPKKRWVMTEGRAETLARGPDTFQLGGTTLAWEGGALIARFDERAAPFGQRLVGEITLTPRQIFGPEIHLDGVGRHRWWPVSPLARAEVRLSQPEITFSGSAYTDANMGDEPLEAAFRRWDWSRGEGAGGATVLYDAELRDGAPLRWAHRFTEGGAMVPVDPQEHAALTAGGWGVDRGTRHDPGEAPTVIRTLEDTPFYCRTLVEAPLGGERLRMMHESLDLDRFDRGWVRFLLPFRMRRR